MFWGNIFDPEILLGKRSGTFEDSVLPYTLLQLEVASLCRVWDEADYVVPPAENGAFFITTNVLVTPNQTQSRCPENPKVTFINKKVTCSNNNQYF